MSDAPVFPTQQRPRQIGESGRRAVRSITIMCRHSAWRMRHHRGQLGGWRFEGEACAPPPRAA